MSQDKDKKIQEIKLEIQLDEEIAQGVYANLAVVNHSDAEFCLDFIFVQPQVPRGKVRARVITSPQHAKRLLGVLQENLRSYEKQHGVIDAGAPGGPQPVGEYH